MAAFRIGVLVLVALGLAPARQGHAGSGQPQPRLLFSATVVAQAGAPADVYSLSAQDAKLAELTFNGGSSPVPSPDGTRVAFARDGGLWVMAADGSHQDRIVRDASEPAWSPDGRNIAYVNRTPDGGQRGIRAVGAGGRGDRLLVDGDAIDPTWARDGRSLAFLRVQTKEVERGFVFTYSLAVLRHGNERTVEPVSDDVSPSWSADGHCLAYVLGGRVALVRPDGSGRRFVGAGEGPVWSPRGRLLAFLRDGALMLFDQRRRPRPDAPPCSRLAADQLVRVVARRSADRVRRRQHRDADDATRHRVALRSQPLAGGVPAGGWARLGIGARCSLSTPEPVEPIAAGNELRFRVPVDEIAADGSRVAYRACGTIGTWQSATGR